MKKYLFLFASLLFVLNNTNASTNPDSLKVSIDWDNEVNRSHKYKKVFCKKDNKYIAWLYLTGKKIEVLDPLSGAKVIRRKGRNGNAPLVFTIEKNGIITQEKVRNAVHPSTKEYSSPILDRMGITTPTIIGSLPKGTITYTSDDGKKIKIGIEFSDSIRDVKIEILSMDEESLYIVEDQKLKPGNYEYCWDGRMNDSGDYILKYTIDGQYMSQTINLEDNAGSWLYRTLKKIF